MVSLDLDFITSSGSSPASEEPKAKASHSEELKELQKEADRNQQEILSNVEIYKQYLQNQLKSGTLQDEITKGVRAGEPLENLFLKAVEAISLMTDNKQYLTIIQKYLNDNKQ